MWRHSYTDAHLRETDQGVSRIMRARDIQSAIDILIPDDPPRNTSEYELAGQVFLRRILACQPAFADADAPPSKAYYVANQASPPLTLLGHYARAGVLSMGLGRYRNGMGYVVGLQETACQYPDDNILTCGAKLGFSILTLAMPIRSEAERLVQSANACTMAVEQHRASGTAVPGHAACQFCIDLYAILIDLAFLSAKTVTGRAADVARSMVLSRASNVDRTTRNILDMRKWAAERMR